MNKLLALADRVEKLTGPDREVDAEIYEITLHAIDYQRVAIKLSDASRLERWHDGWVTVAGAKGEGDPYPEDLPRYTASVDAAMSLVPKRRFVGALSQVDVDGEWYARIEAHDAVFEDAIAATPALALVAASLRARAHGGGEG